MRLADVNVGDDVLVTFLNGQRKTGRVLLVETHGVHVAGKQWSAVVEARYLRPAPPKVVHDPKPRVSLRGAPLPDPYANITPEQNATVDRLRARADEVVERARERLAGKRGPALSRPKAPKPYRSPSYLSFVREHPCLFSVGYSKCEGSIEAHHVGKHPMGQKTDDLRCVPLCTRHHHIITDGLVIADSRAPIAIRLPDDTVIHPEKLAPDLQSVLRQALVLERGVNNLLVEWIARGFR